MTLSPAERVARYRSNHRRDRPSVPPGGIQWLHDVNFRYLADFAEIYWQTMRRVDASDRYFFDEGYFRDAAQGLREQSHLFVALLDGQVISGAIVLRCGDIVQHHLIGTRDEFVVTFAEKIIVDAVADWGNAATACHVIANRRRPGARLRTPLLRYKAGFSDRRHDFHAGPDH